MAVGGKREQWSTSWYEQFRVLLSRSLKERRYEAFNKLRIFQVISVATLGGLLWWHTSPNHIQDRVYMCTLHCTVQAAPLCLVAL